MDTDKALGAWLGLAVGDALGQAVRGLKPEAIRQIFKTLDGYVDVRPVIGRGIKQYRMQGLYGTSTQMAMALAESLTANKKFNSAHFADLLVRLSVGGPDTYFGVFRRPEACWVRTLQDLPNRQDPESATLTTDFATYFPLGLTVALFYGKDSITFRDACIRAASMMTNHPAEITGVVLTAWLVLQLADESAVRLEQAEGVEMFLAQAASLAFEMEEELKARQLLSEGPPPHALSELFQGFADSWADLSEDQFEGWIVETANRFLRQPVHHATQGKALTLLPLAVALVLKHPDRTFEEHVFHAAERGRESVKLAGLVGLLSGARLGLSAIPPALQNGLVNFREVRERGEALNRRRPLKGRDLTATEMGLTRKESEEKKKYLPKEATKKPKEGKASGLEDLFTDMQGEEEDPLAEIRDDPRLWRQFERDKTRKKKERRQKPPTDY